MFESGKLQTNGMHPSVQEHTPFSFSLVWTDERFDFVRKTLCLFGNVCVYPLYVGTDIDRTTEESKEDKQ